MLPTRSTHSITAASRVRSTCGSGGGPCAHTHAAFTLVELSIVLTIIGLLAGGMVAGKILIHNAELKRATNDIATFRTAMGTFEEKYNALPGDMANAVRIWGAHAGGTTDGVDSDCADGRRGGWHRDLQWRRQRLHRQRHRAILQKRIAPGSISPMQVGRWALLGQLTGLAHSAECYS